MRRVRARHFIARVLVAIVVARLRVARTLVGIEAVNGDLARRTLFVGPILRAFGAEIGESTVIHGPLIVHNAAGSYRNLHVANGAHIGRGVFLDLADRISVGTDAVVSMRAVILTHVNAGERPASRWIPAKHAAVAIERDAFIGANCVLMPGVTIGERGVVGAGAVVTRDVAPAVVAVGVPAERLRDIEARH